MSTKVSTDLIDLSGNTGGLVWAKGTTAEQPASATAGEMRVDTTTNTTKVYNGTQWKTLKETDPSFAVDYLVVAGGGGAGGTGGGGGAGGLRTSYNNSTTTTNSLSFPSGKTAIATYMLDNNATDISGNYDGAQSNITYNTGQYGGAAVFNGSSSYIQTTLTKPAGTTFSFSCWINTPGGVAQHIVGDYNSSIANPTFRIQIPANNTLSVGVGTGTGSVSYVSFPTISGLANTWKNLIITVDGTSVNAYINGVALGTTQTSAQTLGAGAQPYTLGAYRPAAGYQNFSGSIDQVRIYDSALSSTDVSNIYNNEVQANSGGGTPAESTTGISLNTAYTVTVGDGGTGAVYPQNGTVGFNSIFSTITSTGGGGGAHGGNGSTGGSGGGGGYAGTGGTAVFNPTQGFAGGGGITAPNYPGGGGGGASAIGANAPTSSTGGNGGAGLEVNILGGTGNYYAGGGGAGVRGGTGGTGGTGGGGNGNGSGVGVAGTVNTGGGGGSGSSTSTGAPTGANGGSGVVIIRYPNTKTITVGAGLTATTAAVGTDSVTTFTAGTGTITFS